MCELIVSKLFESKIKKFSSINLLYLKLILIGELFNDFRFSLYIKKKIIKTKAEKIKILSLLT